MGEIFSLTRSKSEGAKSKLHRLLAKHSDLFKDSYEGMKGLEVHITMKDGAKSIFEDSSLRKAQRPLSMYLSHASWITPTRFSMA